MYIKLKYSLTFLKQSTAFQQIHDESANTQQPSVQCSLIASGKAQQPRLRVISRPQVNKPQRKMFHIVNIAQPARAPVVNTQGHVRTC